MTGPFVWFVVGLIVIPFAFFGIETFRTGGDPTVAKVGGQKITQSQFRAGYEQRLSQLQAMMGENFRQDLVDTDRFRQAVLEDMVQEMLMRQHVRDAGYRASDAILFDTIRNIPAFHENGRFSTEAYRNRLAIQGYTTERFEKQLRESLEIDQMREGILASAFVGDAALAQTYRVEQQQRSLSYAVFEASRYLPKVTVDDAQVRARYEQNASRYQAPERLKVAYVELALDALPEAAEPGEEVLKVLYEADKATRFSTPEERRARHILVAFGDDRDAARSRLESVAQRIRKGADFESLARSHSEDPGSKDEGGNLGWVRRGQMTQKFEEALFALEAGGLSEPVETEFGWHLIRVEEIREARTQAFDDPQVQAELLRLYRRRDAERRYQEMSDKLEQISFESPGSLEPVAEATGLEIRTSDWITRAGGEGIFATPEVRETAFSDDVLGNDENSRPVSVGPNHIAVLRKAAHEPARQKAFDEVADGIREELKNEAARAQAAADAQAVLAEVQEGRELASAARQHGAAVKSPGLVKRTEADVDRAILAALFRMPRPEDDASQATSIPLASGDVAILVTDRVVDPQWPPEAEGERTQQAARMREARAGAEFAAYRTALQRETEVEIIAQPEETPAE